MHHFQLSIWLYGLAVLLALGCHSEVPEGLDEMLLPAKIGVPDKFYDVQALDAQRAIVVGYAGKILMTEDAGRSWTIQNSGTKQALYSVEFVSATEGWIAGQEGTVLHTVDGGKTWERQESGTLLYLFALDFLDEKEGWIVGDKATYLRTTDGGRTWRQAKLARSSGLSEEDALVSQDPVLYDVQFIDRTTGWIVGEFGKIYHTKDGGKTWKEQQESLLGASGLYDVLDIPTFFGVHFIDRNNGLVTGLEGRVARTRDGGQSWKFEEFDVEIPLIDPLFRPHQFADTTAWSVGAAGEVVRQPARSQAWRRAEMGMEVLSWLRGIDFYDQNHGWIVGGYGLILRTEDGGKTWLPSMG